MAFERRRARLGDLAFWLAVASSTLVGLTLVVSEIGSLLGAPPQQAGFSLMVGAGKERARGGYCILGSLAALAVLSTVTLIVITHG